MQGDQVGATPELQEERMAVVEMVRNSWIGNTFRGEVTEFVEHKG
jgi:hypothetical protein